MNCFWDLRFWLSFLSIKFVSAMFMSGKMSMCGSKGGDGGSVTALENHKFYGFLYKIAFRPILEKVGPLLENVGPPLKRFLWNKPLINHCKTSWGHKRNIVSRAVFWQSGLDPPPPWQKFLDPRMISCTQ